MLQTNHPCNLKLWLMPFSPLSFHLCKKSLKRLNVFTFMGLICLKCHYLFANMFTKWIISYQNMNL